MISRGVAFVGVVSLMTNIYGAITLVAPDRLAVTTLFTVSWFLLAIYLKVK